MTNRRLLQAAVSLLSLAAVAWWALHQKAPQLPDSRDGVEVLALALLLYTAASLLRAERWHRILQRSEVGLARPDTYRLTAVGYMGNNTLPARGGDVMRVFLVPSLASSAKRTVAGTVVAERLLDVLALALIFVGAAYGALRGAGVARGTVLIVLAVVAISGLIAAGVVYVLRRLPPVVRAIEFLRPLAASSRALLGRHGVELLALSLAIWTLEASVYLAVGSSLGLHLGVAGSLYVVALTNLSALIPAAPGYVGTFDAVVVLALHSLGHPSSTAVGYLILLRFVLFGPITLVGLVFFLGRYGGLRAGRLQPAKLALRRRAGTG